MSAAAENPTQQTPTNDYVSTSAEHMLTLVQGDVVISTFPQDQTDAAIDLARVLCRALTQPVDLFRVRCREVDSIEAGANAHTAGPGWTHIAHVHFTFRQGVEIVMRDPVLRDASAEQHATP